MVEVELDLVGGRTDGLVTSELELGDEVFVGVLCHTTALVRVKEHVVNVEGSGDERLVVGDGGGDWATGGSLASLESGVDIRGGESLFIVSAFISSGKVVAAEGSDGPEALINGADIKVDLHFVVLYEPLIPSLSGYLSAVSLRSTYCNNETSAGD